MLIDCYPPEDVFARVPELAEQTDPVLRQLDHLLDDDRLFQQVRGDLVRRYRLTAVHGRHSTPTEVVLRLLVVQHLYAWSYAETVQRVADSLVLRWFCRVYFARVPDATTLLRWAQTIQQETLQALNERVALLAYQAKVTRARKLRIDSTCVQSPIHPPTDSGLLGDGVRVLTRLLKQARPFAQAALAGVRDAFRNRMRTMRRALQQLHRMRRHLGAPPDQEPTVVAKAERQRMLYQTLLQAARLTLRQAERVRDVLSVQMLPLPDIPDGFDRGHRAVEQRRRRVLAQFNQFIPLVRQVIHQAQQRVIEGQQVPATVKIVSLFEPHTRIIPRHKGGAALEFGRQVMLDEVDGGILTRAHILADGESEHHQALPAAQQHRRLFGHVPQLVAGDRGLHAAGVEAQLQALGVHQVAIPWTGRVGGARRAHEHERSWRRRYRWRAGIEGRIHVLRRDYGLRRARSHGLSGLARDIGWGIAAHNLHQIAAQLARPHPSKQTKSRRMA
jgi:IS5 family transposase